MDRVQLSSGGASGDTATAAIVADMCRGLLAGDSFRVNVSDFCHVDIIDRAIVIENGIAPISSLITVAGVPKAIVNTSVEADHWSPVTFVPDKNAVTPPPIARSP